MAAIVLAGGQSSRMGSVNKPFLHFRGKTMIAYLIDRLKLVFSDVIIAAKEKDPYINYGVKIAIDSFEHQGPLSGMHAGLELSPDQNNFIVGCDMPFLNLELVEYMLDQSISDILVPRIGENFEPLHSIYSKSCIPEIERAIREDIYKITGFWSNLDMRYIEEAEIKKFDPELYSFLNINTKKDYKRALEIMNKLNKGTKMGRN
jgi:molybdopterin-guanine dinucleotide biosynthesis protein A